MPTYEITLPDGKTYDVDAPDEAGAQAAAAYLLAGGGPTEKPSALLDVAKQIPSGVATGLSELAMLPVTAKRALNSVGDWAFDKVDNGVRSLVGAPPVDPAQRQKQREWADQNLLANRMDNAIFGAQDAIRASRDAALPKPQTLAGEYAKTTGEFFTPSAGGKLNVARKVAETVVPAFVSETAGQATKGTAAEPWARTIGGLAGGVGTGLYQSRMSAVPRAVAGAVGDVTPEQFAAAQQIAATAQRQGVNLTAAEALSAATDGATKLPVLQRVVEGSMEGGQKMAPFFAARPQQMETAARSTFDKIAPAAENPYAIGPQVAEAAEKAIAATPEGVAAQAALEQAARRASGGVEAARAEADAVRRIFDVEQPERLAASQNFAQQQRAGVVAPAEQTAATAEQALKDAIIRSGSATPEQAGRVIQPELAGAVDAMDASRRAANKAAYDQAYANPPPAGLDWAMKDPDVQNAVSQAQRLAAKEATPLTDLFTPGGAPTTRGWDYVLRRLDDQVNGLYRQGSPDAAATAAVRDRLKSALAGPDGPLAQARATARQGRTEMEAAVPPPLAKAVERSPYSGAFAVPPEQVAGLIDRGGASAVEAFTAAASPQARAAFADYYASQMLNRAMDTNGQVNADALARSLRDNADTLSRLPEVASRLQDVIAAQKGSSAAQTGLKSAAKTGDDIVNAIMRGAEADASGTAAQVGVYGNDLIAAATKAGDEITAAARSDAENMVAPWRQGPLGSLASATDAASATARAGETILPRSPMEGAASVLGDAATRVAAQDRDSLAQLVRQRLADTYAKSSRDLVGGGRQNAGALFAKEVAGTPEQRAVLDRVVSVAAPGVEKDLGDLIQTFRATGQRLPQGSNTSVDTMLRQDLGDMSMPSRLFTGVKSLGVSLPLAVNDAAKRAWLGRNTGRLAELFMSPDGIETIMRMQAQKAVSPVKKATGETLLRLPVTTNGQ